jgi:hypothetical protein
MGHAACGATIGGNFAWYALRSTVRLTMPPPHRLGFDHPHSLVNADTTLDGLVEEIHQAGVTHARPALCFASEAAGGMIATCHALPKSQLPLAPAAAKALSAWRSSAGTVDATVRFYILSIQCSITASSHPSSAEPRLAP